MPKHRPPSHNRLLALEQELLEKKRWAEARQGRRDITHVKQGKTEIASKKRHNNNRLLELELEILGQYSSQSPQRKVSQAQILRTEHISRSNNRLLALEQELLGQQHKPKRRKPKSKRSRVQSQVFDTGEAIELQYNSEVFPVSETKTATVSISEKIDNVDQLQIETSEPKLPVAVTFAADKVVSIPQISEEISQETNNSFSQAAEIISALEQNSHHLPAEDISAIFTESKRDRSETPVIPVAPQKKSESDYPHSRASATPYPSDRHNPHAIFDRLGKNMAYATTFDVGTIELEQLFDEFDRTIDQEEQVNQVNKGDSISQRQRDLELQQRFDEFDRTLKLEEQEKEFSSSVVPQFTNSTTPETPIISVTPLTPIISATPLTPIIPTTPLTSIIPVTAATPITSVITTNSITPVNSTYLDTKHESNTIPQFDYKLEALLFRSGINLIALILWLLNLLRRKQIDLQAEIDSRSTAYSLPYSALGRNQVENPNSQIIDINQNDFTPKISPLILSQQRSSFLAISTPVEAFTASKYPLTEILNGEFTRQNSYPLTN